MKRIYVINQLEKTRQTTIGPIDLSCHDGQVGALAAFTNKRKPPESAALFGVWVSARERQPTEEDADDFGEIYWCGKEYVRRETPATVRSWDWTQEHNLNGYWMRTGVTRPSLPNIPITIDSPAVAGGLGSVY